MKVYYLVQIFIFAPIIMIIGESWQQNLSKSLNIDIVCEIPQHGGQGWSEMLAFSQKMKTTACQVDINSRQIAVEIPLFKGFVLPTHFQKQVGWGTRLVILSHVIFD